MNSATSYISDKIEELRINNGSPVYLGLSESVHDKLKKELEAARGQETEGRVQEFLGLPVISMGGPTMPADGVYIHDRNGR